MRCQLKIHLSATSSSFSFSFLSPKSPTLQRHATPIPWTFLKVFIGFCDCITHSLPLVLLLFSYFLNDSSSCQSLPLAFCCIHVFGNTIQSHDFNHHLCLDKCQISLFLHQSPSPSLSPFVSPSALLFPLHLCSANGLLKSHLFFISIFSRVQLPSSMLFPDFRGPSSTRSRWNFSTRLWIHINKYWLT